MKKFILAAFAASILSFCGCSNGVMTRFEQRNTVGLTSTAIGDLVIPVFTISEGPSMTTYQSIKANSTLSFSGTAIVTNKTEALGMYKSEEGKYFCFTGTVSVVSTNNISEK